MDSKCPSGKNCISKIDRAIQKLKDARCDTQNENFEQAEDHLADSLHYIAEALHCINQLEEPPTLPNPCDPTGAIPLTSGLNGAPSGTSNLRPGNKYVTPVFGYVITWEGDTITVCEGPNNQNVWSISGAPLVITSGNGSQQIVPSLSGNPQAAAVGLNEGSALVFSASTVNGPVTNARYVSNAVIQTSSSYQGFDTTATEFYLSGYSGQIILDSGFTLNDMLGV
jgi:hypothetical protein